MCGRFNMVGGPKLFFIFVGFSGLSCHQESWFSMGICCYFHWFNWLAWKPEANAGRLPTGLYTVILYGLLFIIIYYFNLYLHVYTLQILGWWNSYNNFTEEVSNNINLVQSSYGFKILEQPLVGSQEKLTTSRFYLTWDKALWFFPQPHHYIWGNHQLHIPAWPAL